MKKLKYFAAPLFFSCIALVILLMFNHSLSALYLVLVLSLLEISLSFDNAVVNAKILETMPPKWRKRFLIWGIIIAVFLMRLLLPMVLVYCTSSLGGLEVIYTAIYAPQKYHEALEQARPLISAFGGAFLWLVFLEFLLDSRPRIVWFGCLENSNIIRKMQKIPGSGMALTFFIGILLSWRLHNAAIAKAFIIGMLLQIILSTFRRFFAKVKVGLSQGLIGFIYLEFLDASFSFDGVIGAFAIANDIFVIMVGLGIGALFVRSFTLLLVEKEALKTFRYLDHGAHYAIGFLATMMFLQLFVPVPEILPGAVSLILIVSALANRLTP